MSYSKIDNAYNALIRFIPEDEKPLRESLSYIVTEIKQVQYNNIQAWIPVSSITMKSSDISEYEWMTDYEIVTGTHTAPNGSEWRSEEAYREHLEEKSALVYKIESLFVVYDPRYPSITFGWDGSEAVEGSTCTDVEDAEEAIAYLKEHSDEEANWSFRNHYVIFKYDPDNGDLKDLESEHESEQVAEDEIDELRVAWVEDELSELGELVCDEIMLNYIYRYGYKRTINHDLAQDLGMAVIRFNKGEHEDEEFMVPKECGTDMTPTYVCYKAIEFGYVDENDVRWFEDYNRDYFISEVGLDMYNRALQALDLERFIKEQSDVC
ncbi:hypothetical protein P4V86_03700 [Brevibacillus laterosporus]|uniref:hypothetical protein n=1 Tax=Brevibacillus laterosporus TaxID=1465 RepID=UPI0003738FD8|nr:hypothetical protein [Brevibacillus laterosporus]ATO48620.1 hypothetical protein BrL25_05510 [Brevibacillus laterosporus DSM 25]MED2002463.1 hypothetical protein [Brevibacillus laterosporus]